MNAGLKSRRQWMNYYFKNPEATGLTVEDEEEIIGPVTCSSVIEEDNDWMIHNFAFTMETTNTQNLSHIPMEHLAVSKARMKYLMLVKVEDDISLMKGKATKVDFQHTLPRTTISGQGYYTLKCSVTNTRFRDFLISSKNSEL